jgi:Protein of unknown function, DUF547
MSIPIIGRSEKASVITVSQQLLLGAKNNQPCDSLIQVLTTISEKQLEEELNNDLAKKTFWINIYNAFTQLLLSSNPDQYKNRTAFFGKKQITIAGKKLSLDNIEHGILRRSKNKWSFGYFNTIFHSRFEKNNRVDTLDYQIHFALNCGAKSCPPIAFYSSAKLIEQLNLATKVYLQGESIWNDSVSTIYLPKLMSWFSADFGGKKGMKALIKKYDLAPSSEKLKIRFKKYDWTLQLAQY